MIGRLLVGAGKSLFILACGFLAVAGLAMYGAWRLLRAGVSRENPMPVRDSAFALLLAAGALLRALQAQAQTHDYDEVRSELGLDLVDVRGEEDGA